MSKFCIHCGTQKVVRKDRIRNGVQHFTIRCLECERQRYRRYRQQPGYVQQRMEAWRKKYPEKDRAHKAVYDAVKRGQLVRQPCEACGETRVHAHHEDYSKPLEVRWLCHPCHEVAHHGRLDPSLVPRHFGAVGHEGA